MHKNKPERVKITDADRIRSLTRELTEVLRRLGAFEDATCLYGARSRTNTDHNQNWEKRRDMSKSKKSRKTESTPQFVPPPPPDGLTALRVAMTTATGAPLGTAEHDDDLLLVRAAYRLSRLTEERDAARTALRNLAAHALNTAQSAGALTPPQPQPPAPRRRVNGQEA